MALGVTNDRELGQKQLETNRESQSKSFPRDCKTFDD